MRNIETLLTSEKLGPHGSINTPLYLSSTFGFPTVGHAADVFAGRVEGNVYSRVGNPTVQEFEDKMSMIECDKPKYGCAFSSGMAAITSVILTTCKPGDHILCVEELYGGTHELLEELAVKFNICVQYFQPDLNFDEENISDKVKLVFVETPTNPSLHTVDLEKLREKVYNKFRRYDRGFPLICVDNTFATPIYQQPLMSGMADIVLHSVTKYIGGHGDLIGGVVVSDFSRFIEHLKKTRTRTGGVMDPLTAFLCLRGLKTLHLRMERHTECASEISGVLRWGDWTVVDNYKYPGFGGMINIEFESSYMVDDFISHFDMGTVAVSLGETRTLINVPYYMTHSTYSEGELNSLGISPGLVRMSVGLENPIEMRNGFHRALELLERG